jgi:hypothetical protein
MGRTQMYTFSIYLYTSSGEFLSKSDVREEEKRDNL